MSDRDAVFNWGVAVAVLPMALTSPYGWASGLAVGVLLLWKVGWEHE